MASAVRSSVLGFTVMAVFLTVSACGGAVVAPSSSTPSVSPTELPVASTAAIPLPNGCNDAAPCALAAGTYVLTGDFAFMQGLTVQVPAPGKSAEQDQGEFRVAIDGTPGEIRFWKDLTPVAADGTQMVNAGKTTAQVVAWLQASPQFVTSKPEQVTIGDGVPATTILVGVSDTAKNIDPDCPVAVCAGVFTDTEHWNGAYAIGRQDDPLYVRLYLADIMVGSTPHTLIVALDPGDAASLPALEAAAKPVLDSIRLPQGG
jgi:hypothetical protein